MMAMLKPKPAFCTVLGVWLWQTIASGPTARADTAVLPDRIRIAYEAPANCPRRPEFVQQVTQRVKLAWVADETEAARQIHVVLTALEPGYSARLEYADNALHRVVRTVNTSDCEQAVSAIALVTALAIDSQTVFAGPTNWEASDQPPINVAKSTLSPPVTEPGIRNRTATVQPIDRSESPPIVQEAGIRLGLAAGFAPGVAMGAGALWGIGRRPLPRFRIALNWYDKQITAADSTSPGAHFGLLAASANVCESQQPTAAVRVVAAACAGVESGLYAVKGVAPTSPDGTTSSSIVVHQHKMLWVSMLAIAPIRVDYRDSFFEFTPEFRVPLVSGKFQYVAPYRPVFEIPRVALGLGIAMGLTIP